MMSSNLLGLLRFGVVWFPKHRPRRISPFKRRFNTSPAVAVAATKSQQTSEQLLVIVGAGASGMYASIRAKEVAPHLRVLIIEKGKPLSKVKISGGGRCNVTNGHFLEKIRLAENYPRGSRELRGSFFDIHGPEDTMCWFSDRGVELKTEEDGRVFPVSNNSASIVDCLLHEAMKRGVSLQTGKVVSDVSINDNGKFLLKVEKRTIDLVEYMEADYLLVATGSCQQGYAIAVRLGHSIVDPRPSLFTFKIDDAQLPNLSGVSFPKVKAKLKLENVHRKAPEFTQTGPMLVTHWGLSGPVILRLSAWGARDLFLSNYKGMLFVDFAPDIHIEEMKRIIFQHKDEFGRQKANNSFPQEFGLVKRFWRFLLELENVDGDTLWASIPNKCLNALALQVKQCPFKVIGKGQFKDEFVTAGGVPLAEISLNTMESRIRPNLFFAGEVLNIDGITGGFNFQNAWTGGYIAGTTMGKLASNCCPQLQADG